MSISRQKSVTRKFILPTKAESNSHIGSCSTLDCDAVGEFKKMKEVLHNFFDEAKKELSTIYKNVVNWVNETWDAVKNNKDVSQKITDKIVQVRRVSETVMPDLKNHLISVLLIPKIIAKNTQNKFLLNPESNDYFFNNIDEQNRKLKTTPSSLKAQHSSIDRTIGRSSTHKIKSSQINNPQDLKILENNSQKLKCIDLTGKPFLQSYKFSEFKAPNLEILNLHKNNIIDLTCLKQTNFPNLIQLNLSQNNIKNIQSLPQTSFPKLNILNLSNNSITDIEPLTKCKFNNLLILNLSFNNLQNVQNLNNCHFEHLQTLNLDHNTIKSIPTLSKTTFSKLKALSFAHNFITQITFLSKLPIKTLQAIIGDHNKIFSIEPLSTATLPNLKQIILHNNLVSDVSSIKKMTFPQLTCFDLEFNNIEPQNIGCFFSGDKSIKEAKNKFPFLQI